MSEFERLYNAKKQEMAELTQKYGVNETFVQNKIDFDGTYPTEEDFKNKHEKMLQREARREKYKNGIRANQERT